MAVEGSKELDVFISSDDFGVTAKYTPTGSVARMIKGIFDSEYLEVAAGGEVGFAISQPRFLTKTSNVSTAQDGDTIVINGSTYKVRVVQPDGTGMTNLVLEKQ